MQERSPCSTLMEDPLTALTMQHHHDSCLQLLTLLTRGEKLLALVTSRNQVSFSEKLRRINVLSGHVITTPEIQA